jgi:hypothetical protein
MIDSQMVGLILTNLLFTKNAFTVGLFWTSFGGELTCCGPPRDATNQADEWGGSLSDCSAVPTYDNIS